MIINKSLRLYDGCARVIQTNEIAYYCKHPSLLVSICIILYFCLGMSFYRNIFCTRHLDLYYNIRMVQQIFFPHKSKYIYQGIAHSTTKVIERPRSAFRQVCKIRQHKLGCHND